MIDLNQYIKRMGNREKVRDLEKEILGHELKIDKMESERLIIKKIC